MDDTLPTDTPPRTLDFQAEIKQLLNILVHSVYTSKDVFIRELISNATDALEKVRFLQVQGKELHGPDIPLEIRIETMEEGERKKLVITDTGVGMTEDEVCTNIGTIAKSGASGFLERLQQESPEGPQELSLIGRFGIGFYSVFIAADHVELTTRTADTDGQAVCWTSDGGGTYTLQTLDEDQERGTRVEIWLRKEDERFADVETVKTAIKRYSNFVGFPILVNGELVNQTMALWREPQHQIKDVQYNEFYKLVCHDFQDPQLRLHFAADAPVQFSGLLYVPTSNPEMMGFGHGELSLQLFVKRVLIDGENKDLLPPYLRFVKGVVESEDLPLNISRETLQENVQLKSIRKLLTRQLLKLFLETAKEEPDQYRILWQTFGKVIKEGYSDHEQREIFQELLRFNSSRHTDQDGHISLGEYVEAMPAGQQAIYYLSGPSRESLQRDPRLELFRNKGVEVLYLCEVADEFVLNHLGEYKEKQLVSADQVNPADLQEIGKGSQEDSAEKKKEDELREDSEAAQDAGLQAVIDSFKKVLGERVIDVRASQRLVDSPACLVGDDKQMSGQMDRLMRMMNKTPELPQRVLELNQRHRLIRGLARILEQNPDDPFVANACEQLFEGAMLVDGYLADPHRLVERINQLLEETASLKAGESAEA